LSPKESLLARIDDGSVRAGVIGLGYVGLPLAVEIARSGLTVVGVDTAPDKVATIQDGRSYIEDVPEEAVAELREAGTLSATTDLDVLAECDTINICVPTPLRKTRDPDLSFVMAAVDAIGGRLRAGQLIILESTTYPGTTNELVQPRLEETGLRAGKDVFLAFSPERVDPGPSHRNYTIRTVPKVVGGVTSECTDVACAFYERIVDTVVRVSDSQVAEMVKLLENTYRSVNIGMVNELALMCHSLGVDVWEVIDAAATKPYGFQAFYPGPGLGGHCIPVDPFYLAWKARVSGFEPRFIELAGQINASMPRFVVSLVADALNSVGKPVREARVHVLGVAYKRDVKDVRESPALEIILELEQRRAHVSYSDPYVPSLAIGERTYRSVPVDDGAVRGADCVLIVTDHGCFDWDRIVAEAPLIVDTRNALRGRRDPKIWRL
jgi:UDP-N-acetyl-D-glucosamine dehydrogenase